MKLEISESFIASARRFLTSFKNCTFSSRLTAGTLPDLKINDHGLTVHMHAVTSIGLGKIPLS